MEEVIQKLSEKNENKYVRYLSDITYYNNDTIGLTKPENKLKVFTANLISTIVNCNDTNRTDFENEFLFLLPENDLISLLNNENIYVSIFPTFKVNNNVYDFNKRLEKILDINEITELLNNGKTIVIYSIHYDSFKDNIIKFRCVLLDTEIQINCETKENDYYTKTLDEIVTTLNTGEETQTVSEIKAILKKVIENDYVGGSLSFSVKPVDKETAEEANKKYNEYMDNIKFKENVNLSLSVFGKFAFSLDFINDDDPFEFLDIVDNINLDSYYNRVDNDISDSVYDEFIETYEKLNNHPVIIAKRDIYNKWKDRNINILNISKYKVANCIESIDYLIKAYNILNIKRISRNTCINSALLVIRVLKNDFNPFDFFEKYTYAISENFDKYFAEMRLNNKLMTNSEFISEFISQYVAQKKPKINLIKSE